MVDLYTPSPELWAPHNYQLTAMSFLIANPCSGLFLDPGMGKTSIALAVIKILRGSGASRGVLMVAPVRVAQNVWPSEIAKWANFAGLTYAVLHGDGKAALWGPPVDLYLINPEGLPWLYDELARGLRAGGKCPFNTLWIDESTKFKNHDTKARFKLVKDMIPLFTRRHIMTGTPAPKGLLDLWSQVYILDEGKALTDSYHHFRNRYFETEKWNKYNWKLKDFAADSIHEAIAPLVLEMAAEDYLDMPPLVYNDIWIDLPEDALKKYKEMERDFFTVVDGEETTAESSAQASLKCRQLANGVSYEDIPEDLDDDELRSFMRTRKKLFLHSEKLPALQDLIDELNGKPLLVAYHFKHDLKALRDLLGKDVPHIGSGVGGKQLDALVRRWNAGELPTMVVHPGSMAHGLNLQQGGNDLAWYGATWNLEEYMQLIRRLYRQGVIGTVRVHHLLARNTLEEAMLLRLGERAEEQQDLRTAIKLYRSAML